MKVAVVGAGWAGCAAAVEATRLGHEVILLEASRHPGGRARALVQADAGRTFSLDNGQHILIGAYRDTLQLMRDLGVEVDASFQRLPLTLKTPQGRGLQLPGGWPAQLAVLAGVLGARGWRWSDKLSLLRTALRWQRAGFECGAHETVSDLCAELSPAVFSQCVEPLCISALNTPAHRASAQVFLRVMKDALFGEAGGADLLLPTRDLGALLPDPALAWLREKGQTVRLATRVSQLSRRDTRWHLGIASPTQAPPLEAQAVILACPAAQAAHLLAPLADAAWTQAAQDLTHEAIATVYAWAASTRLARPMLALPCGPAAPAQFVFDRGQLGGPPGLLAFVVSASQGTREAIEAAVLAQAREQLGLAHLEAFKTVVEKRATFACTPALQRPGRQPRAGDASLQTCGDYIEGPYPATLEGAVRSGIAAARALPQDSGLR